MSKLKKRLENIIHTVKYALPFTVATFVAQEAKGQEFVYPSGVINPFISPDNTETATIYNSLNSGTKAERDALLNNIIRASRVHTIPANTNPVFNCDNWSQLQIVNAYDWGDNVYDYAWDRFMYNRYSGFVLSEIYANGGTLADAGKDGLPMMGVGIYDPITRPIGHSMNLVFTGNNILDPADGNTIEPRDGLTAQQPGDGNIPINCERFAIGLPYIFKNSAHEKNYGSYRILEFKIVNGQKILTYNINDDPLYNTRVRLITQRESDPPTIDIKQGTAPDSLVATIKDANIKSIWYTIDGGEKIPLMTEVLAPVTEKKIAIKMNLPTGTHQIKVGTDDYFRYITEKTEQRNIEAIINAPPIINITTPTEGTIYDKDIDLVYNIVDDDFASAWYSLDNGITKVTVGKSGTIKLQLNDGIKKLLMEATDRKPQTTSQSINFEINRPPVIMITTPTEGTKYDKNISLIYAITDTDFQSAWYSLDGGTTKVTIGQSGTIPLDLANGLYTLLLQATDKRPQTTSATKNFEMDKVTGIEDPTIKEGFVLYPNPVKEYLKVKHVLERPETISREIYSITGTLLDHDKIDLSIGENIEEVYVGNLAKGMYIMLETFHNSEGKPVTKEHKFVRQ